MRANRAFRRKALHNPSKNLVASLSLPDLLEYRGAGNDCDP